MNPEEQNQNDKLSMFQKGRHIAVIIALILGGAGSMTALQAYELHQHRNENELLADKMMQVDFNHYYDMRECSNEPFAATELIENGWDESVSAVVYPETLDLSTPGEKQVDYILRYKDDLGEMHRKIYTKKIRTRDTLPPQIKLASELVEIWQYAGFDPADYIESVYDAVVGNMEVADEPTPGKYTIDSNVDSNTPGNYTITVKAEDLSGNTAEKSFDVAVYQKPVQRVAQPVAQQVYANNYNNYAYSSGYSGYTDYSYSAPAYVYSGGTNFDSYYGVSEGDSQAIVDAGGIAYQGGDYFHHNTSDFMNQFWGTQSGDTVTLNGTNYTCTGIGHGYVGDGGYTIYDDNGNAVYADGNPNLITCDGAPGTDQRWIMYLEPQN